MSQDESITLYNWILQEFTTSRRAEFVNLIAPHIKLFFQPRDHVLDLCCGTGPISFWLEGQGAYVTAIDFAPYMIDLARQEAARLGSAVNFVQADVLSHPLPAEEFDLVVFLGNTVSDFSLQSFRRLSYKVKDALKPNKQFIIHYIDGLYSFIQGNYPKESIQQETPIRITRCFKGYLPETGAYIDVYKNEASGEVYEYTSYLYTPPLVRLAINESFKFEQSIVLTPRSFVDVFVKQ